MNYQKDLLRKQMRKLKRALSIEQKLADEKAVFNRIHSAGLLKGAKHVMLYYSLPDELPTHATVEQWAAEGIFQIYLPRVKGDDIEVVPYTGPESLSDDNPFHIAEPVGDAVDCSILDAIIVPGVAFDCHCNRMGRGKGFYDRLLSRGKLYTIGVCHDCQLLDEIPCEPHDRPLDCVVSPTHFFINKP
ncbi:MAG: 5-formyltetrahydrofolate cyclo-ligase [Muribaculaceae bacterium]|nr:5-formyltetrahydrofolate cyclo-ligase [Muribaculaceae bacterium]